MGLPWTGVRAWVGLAMAAGLLLGAGAGFGAELTVAAISPPRTAAPGDVAIHVFALANPSPLPIEVALRAQVPPGWEHLGLPPTLSLPAGEEDTVFLAVIVPRTAEAGLYAVRLRVHDLAGDVVAEAEAAVRVLAAAGVELVPPATGEAQPGDSVTYELSIVNRGNGLDRFSVEVSSASGWPVRAEPRDVSLRPGERGTVRIVLSIPAQAAPGRDLLTVAVRSREGAAARTAWFTTILPPGPEAIVGTVLSELEMRVGGRLG